MTNPKWFPRIMTAVIAFTLCGGPQLASAQQPAPAPQKQTTQKDQNVGTSQESATPDPSKGPLQPQELPNAPSAEKTPASATNSADQKQPIQEAPLGAAAAKAPKTAGGAASRPAGTAIAPAKQHQVRSLLIKLGAIAAGAAAVGVVYGLTRSTPSLPPGTQNATNPPVIR